MWNHYFRCRGTKSTRTKYRKGLPDWSSCSYVLLSMQLNFQSALKMCDVSMHSSQLFDSCTPKYCTGIKWRQWHSEKTKYATNQSIEHKYVFVSNRRQLDWCCQPHVRICCAADAGLGSWWVVTLLPWGCSTRWQLLTTSTIPHCCASSTSLTGCLHEAIVAATGRSDRLRRQSPRVNSMLRHARISAWGVTR